MNGKSAEDLSLAALWRERYKQERIRSSSLRSALRSARRSRDRWKGMALEYERQLGVRR